MKNWVQGGNAQKPLGPLMHMTVAAEAGVLTLMLTNPVWVVKTRLVACKLFSSFSFSFDIIEMKVRNLVVAIIRRISHLWRHNIQ